MIEIIDFKKVYDDSLAVAGITFRVEAGQILGLVGPNGAGKTTTLRTLAGILPSSGGRLLVGGYDVDQEPLEVKRRTAYVPDDPQLFHDLTVEQHLAFTASVYEVAAAEEKITELLRMFDLEFKRTTRASDLSRGMRQKLAVCCGYLHDPQVLLLDEPMTGLDPKGIRVLKESIRMRAEQGAAVIISSHLLAMVEDICSHVCILDLGRQCFFGTIDQLRDAYGEPTRRVERSGGVSSNSSPGDDGDSLEDIFFRALDGFSRLSDTPTTPVSSGSERTDEKADCAHV